MEEKQMEDKKTIVLILRGWVSDGFFIEGLVDYIYDKDVAARMEAYKQEQYDSWRGYDYPGLANFILDNMRREAVAEKLQELSSVEVKEYVEEVNTELFQSAEGGYSDEELAQLDEDDWDDLARYAISQIDQDNITYLVREVYLRY